jgi:hypothetical protein
MSMSDYCLLIKCPLGPVFTVPLSLLLLGSPKHGLTQLTVKMAQGRVCSILPTIPWT